jgi:hypothetical protein
LGLYVFVTTYLASKLALLRGDEAKANKATGTK